MERREESNLKRQLYHERAERRVAEFELLQAQFREENKCREEQEATDKEKQWEQVGKLLDVLTQPDTPVGPPAPDGPVEPPVESVIPELANIVVLV